MKDRRFKSLFLRLIASLFALGVMTSCIRTREDEEPFDEHYGMIEVPYSNRTAWIRPKEGAELNTFTPSDFSAD